jgi:DnaK suppressor protein
VPVFATVIDIVCHRAPLYKARANGPRPLAWGSKGEAPAVKNGQTLEKLKNYRPSEKEPFMNDRQRDYFRAKLLAWKDEILRESKLTLQTLQEENVNHPDLADRASSETDRAIELRARDRQRKLISKIDAALQRIEDNTYGYCEETGEPISLKRLEARPIATLSVEAQERHEKREKVYRDE